MLRRLLPISIAPPSFCFDIDGVFLRNTRVLPAARKALSLLFPTPTSEPVAPFVFLTNGGGHLESERATYLSSLFSYPIHPHQVILSHTPLRQISSKFSCPDRSTLVIGPPSTLSVARSYNFRHVISPMHKHIHNPSLIPFCSPCAESDLSPELHESASLPIGVILVMSDSSNWYIDSQIVIDALHQSTPPHIYFCNSDLTFPSSHDRPRLAGGAFRHIILSLGEKILGCLSHVHIHNVGKPHTANYVLADRALQMERRRLNIASGGRVYAVGDNPASDIRGANSYGGGWQSILVRTGNFTDKTCNDRIDPARFVVEDVHEAILHAFDNESVKTIRGST